MKKFFYVAVIAVSLLGMVASCGSKSGSNDGSNASSTEAVENSEGSSEVDEFLDAYEEAVDACIDVANKVKSGDTSAMSDLTAAEAKMSEAVEKLDNLKGEMTAAQTERLTKIAAKAASVAQ